MARVLKTKMVGQMPDSRDLMAPPEIVYVVEGEVKERWWTKRRVVMIFCLVAAIWWPIFLSGVAYERFLVH